MTQRILGPTGGRRRKRLALFVPLVVVLGLVVTGLVGAVPLPPTPPAVNNPQFEFDANETGKNGVLTDDAATDGELDWDDTNQDGTDRDGTPVIVASRNPDGTCTQTNLPDSPGGPNVVGAGLLVCDGSAGNYDDQDAFTQGSKNEGTNWNIDNIGSPKKADLAELMIYAKFGDSPAANDPDLNPDDLFIFTGANRLDKNGDTHIDVELNKFNVKRDCPDSELDTPGYQTNNCVPQRTNGDVLIAIDLAQGGTTPSLRVFQFKTTLGAGEVCENAPQVNPPCLVRVTAPGSAAVGAVNDVPGQIQGPNWNSVGCDPTPPDDGTSGCKIRDDIMARGFMETFTDLGAFGIDVTCPGFSEVIFKTRSSDSLNSSLQDDAEATLHISRCSLAWEKRDDLGALQGGATFTVGTAGGANGDGNGPFACLDSNNTGADDNNPVTVVDGGANDSDPDAGQLLLDNICFGAYVVTETVSPSGFALDDDTTRSVTVGAADTNAVIGTQGQDDPGNTDESDFHNRLGTLEWEKRDQTNGTTGNHVLQGGATFSVAPDPANGSTGSLTGITDCIVAPCGGADKDADAGQFLLTRVRLGSYTITETAAPTGYQMDTDVDRTVSVSAADLSGTVGTEPLGAPPGTDDEGTRSNGTCVEPNDNCDFHNRKGSLLIRKETKNVNTPEPNDLLGGATFTITPDPRTNTGSLTGVTDCIVLPCAGVDVNPTPGLFCIDNALVGVNFSITETAAPAGYKLAVPATQSNKQATASSCADRAANPTADATFVNAPLSKITVSFESLAAGNPTSATIACTGPDVNLTTTPLPEGTPRVLGNGTTTLVEGTYNCTVVIDP